MKCPKCSYVSHDYLDVCRKCGVDLVSFKRGMGLLVLQPGVLDLSLVLGEAGADDLFESMAEETTMHAGHDVDFKTSLDDDADHAGARRADVGVSRSGAQTGLDHLTLSFDTTDLRAELQASLPAAPASPPPAVPGETALPEHVTLELDLNSRSVELPSGALAELAPMLPPRVPETAATPVEGSETTDSVEAEQAEGIDDVVSVTEVSGALASVSSQDIGLAEDTPVVPEEQVPEIDDLDSATIEIPDVDAASSPLEAQRGAEPPEVEEPVDTTLDILEPSVDDALVTLQVHEPSDSDRTEVIEPTRSTVDAPASQEMSLLPLELPADTSDSTFETTLPEFAMATLDDAASMFMDETMPLTPPSPELMATTGDAPPEDAVTSAETPALDDLAGLTLPGDLNIEPSPPETGPERDFTTSDALALGAFDDTTLPGHLTLDFDISALRADLSSAPPDDVRRDDLPGDVQSEMSPPQNQAEDEDELRLDLDLDDVASDDDTPA